MAIHELFAYLHVKNAAAAIDFYTKAFGAKETLRLADASGRIGHAQLDFGGNVFPGDAAYPAAGRAEAEHVAFLEDPAGYQPPVDPGSVTR